MPDELIARAPKAERERSMTEVAERAYDPNRLRRGAVRAVRKVGAHQYIVAGKHEKQYDVNLELDTPCDCRDAFYRGRGCLHELAARLHDGDGPLIQSLGTLLLRAEQARQENGQ